MTIFMVQDQVGDNSHFKELYSDIIFNTQFTYIVMLYD